MKLISLSTRKDIQHEIDPDRIRPIDAVADSRHNIV